MTAVLALVLILTARFPIMAADPQDPYQQVTVTHDGAEFSYELFLTDQTGMPVSNPRTIAAGDTLRVEIHLERNRYTEPSYASYGIEFRLLTRGLKYNNDGSTLRRGTSVRLAHYMDGDSVGFAWYDLAQVGEDFANPVLAAAWSYTVEDPDAVNLTVPVALIYLAGDKSQHVPIGPAWLFLEPNGGTLQGADISGEYTSGTEVTLPGVTLGDYVFEGWSDGARLYPAGSRFTASGIVTLTALWADLVRDRYISFLPDGGTLTDPDPSGYYADGETIILPGASRESYRFLGWSDGKETFAPGTGYAVNNTVNLTARWELIPAEPDPVVPVEPVEPVDPTEPQDPEEPAGSAALKAAAALGTAAGSGGLLWWLLLLWKSRRVLYELNTGDVSLFFKDSRRRTQVEVVLYRGTQEYHLNKSGMVEIKQRLRFIKNDKRVPVAEIETGSYPGKLIVTGDGYEKIIRCRIKAHRKESQ